MGIIRASDTTTPIITCTDIIDSYNYYNLSDRVDYNLNDKWRLFGYYGRYHSEDIREPDAE